MKLKGISLPINTVVILLAAFLVLVLIIYMIIQGTDTSLITNQDAFNRGCRVYVETGQIPSTIILGDVTNDGNEDNLLTVCRLHYMDSNMDNEGCMKKCQKIFPYGKIGGTGGSSTICPVGTEAINYCSATGAGSSCGGNCYCSSGSTCAPLRANDVKCSRSYECKSNCCEIENLKLICVATGVNCQADTRP
ncbi:MAG: hypothetical protein DRP06_01610 [Candidatus Aenigmatarchaeota archaeon]|nr:MAG: hypothetical protein DRP06_01610 [Candidatus Aenigmarchaeota archaeon]